MLAGSAGSIFARSRATRSSSRRRELNHRGQFPFVLRTLLRAPRKNSLRFPRNRGFESTSLQRRVNKLSVPREGMSVEGAFELQPDPDRPNVLRFEWTLLSGDASVVPRSALRPTRRLYFAIHDRLHRADHAPQRLPIGKNYWVCFCVELVMR